MRDKIRHTIEASVSSLEIVGKMGKDRLQGMIADALNNAGFVADKEDTRGFLRPGMPVWRDKDTSGVEVTARRRLIDIVVYADRDVVALVETESDLDDLRPLGVTKRNRHYDVHSIARSANGKHFDSYKSLERMAAAIFYRQLATYPEPNAAAATLDKVCSDDPRVHNPRGLPMILVSGRCRARDRPILEPRLKSLGAELLCINLRG